MVCSQIESAAFGKRHDWNPKMTSTITLLDCTMRDGGYYNDWDFPVDLAREYVAALADANVPIIELGFRFPPNGQSLGPFAHTPEWLVNMLDLPEGPVYGVMLNAGDYLGPDGLDLIDRAFVPAAASRIDLVRIAAHLRQVAACRPMVQRLADLGYRVGFNIMQASEAANDAVLSDLAGIVAGFGSAVEVLYFADSLGNMTPQDVTRIAGLFRARWDGPLGFHGHDNIGLGVANAIAAVEAGITWVDGTITGMGRGAGNAQTEYLLIEAERRGWAKVIPSPVHALAAGPFTEMQRQYGWGKNVFYYAAGIRSVHPTYVQDMLGGARFAPVDIMSMIDLLAEAGGGASFKAKGIEQALASRFTDGTGTADLTNMWQGEQVFMIAGGQTASDIWPALRTFVRKNGGRIVTVNQPSFVDPADVDAVVCVHPARLLALLGNRAWSRVPVILPLAAFPARLAADASARLNIRDYGMRVDQSAVAASATGCALPAPLAGAYGWCVAAAAGASHLYLAGFDGYDGRSQEFRDMETSIAKLTESLPLPVSALTQTLYPLPAASLYTL